MTLESSRASDTVRLTSAIASRWIEVMERRTASGPISSTISTKFEVVAGRGDDGGKRIVHPLPGDSRHCAHLPMFCCCCGHQDNGVSLTRRSMLGVVAGLVVAGCRPRRHRPTAPVVDDEAAVRAALTAERGLLAGYDQPVAARERHAAHEQALRTLLGSPPPSPTVPASPSQPSRLGLRSSAAELQNAAVSAQDGRVAAVLASIAAEHAADADR